ncbi:MAG: hypothetical protein ABI882_00035 [Acidobacteriota bacterium]
METIRRKVSSPWSVAEIRGQIVGEVRSWCRGAALHDDLTLVVVKIRD